MDRNGTQGNESETQQATIEWLMQSHQAQQNVNAQLLNAIAALQQSVNRSQNATPSVTISVPEPLLETAPQQEPHRPKHILPKPEYDHEDPSLFPQFRGLLYTKVYGVDTLACGNTEVERVWFSFACLKGKAAARVFPWIEFCQRTSQPLLLENFFTQLDSAFSDPQKIQKAIGKLNGFKQANKSFRDFHYEFEQALLEANGWNWDDAVKKGYLRQGLSYELKAAVVAQVEPMSYSAFVDQLRIVADNLESLKQSAWKPRSEAFPSQKPPTNFYTNQSTNPARNEPMDWEPSPQVFNTRGFVSKDTQQKRRDRNACIKCGKTGHYARECQTGWKPDDPRQRTKRAAKVEGKPQETSSELESDSGKE
jgi:hypothetical protein